MKIRKVIWFKLLYCRKTNSDKNFDKVRPQHPSLFQKFWSPQRLQRSWYSINRFTTTELRPFQFLSSILWNEGPEFVNSSLVRTKFSFYYSESLSTCDVLVSPVPQNGSYASWEGVGYHPPLREGKGKENIVLRPWRSRVWKERLVKYGGRNRRETSAPNEEQFWRVRSWRLSLGSVFLAVFLSPLFPPLSHSKKTFEEREATFQETLFVAPTTYHSGLGSPVNEIFRV